jgi:hypothetical protein
MIVQMFVQERPEHAVARLTAGEVSPAGLNALVRAFKRAAASGAGMRVVVSARAVQRVLAITGVDQAC